MENEHEQRPDASRVNLARRRLTKAGLAAPAVLGTLASRNVFGAAPHNCTRSGQVSGNASTHEQGTCSELGPNTLADLVDAWPWPETTAYHSDFVNKSRLLLALARNFGNTPFSSTQFANAYRAEAVSDTVTSRPATVLEVMLGFIPTYGTDGTYSVTPDGNFALTANRPGRAPILLGQEAIVAYVNAIEGAPGFPLHESEVVQMFNSIVTTGSYTVVSGSQTAAWDSARVLEYFQSLHA
jgi:hypothetical protein